MQFTPILGAVIPQAFDSMRYGNGITEILSCPTWSKLAQSHGQKCAAT